ncbi:hypothetical protein ACTJJ4_11550 [Microbacterium sp. 22195]|uniref:hypothetical protein n=1 Tax=Microbacterium sp. 22195 TaxID=3453891 RepID=UPI003F83C95E
MRILLPVVFVLVSIATIALTFTAIAMFVMSQIGPGMAALVGAVVCGLVTRSVWKQLNAPA